MGVICCKDCSERYVGCHSFCEKYKEERAELDRLKELERRDEDFRRYTQDRNAKRREIIRKRKLANKFHHRHHN